ncbi:MAG: sensor histidine kinase [Pseudomonadota bacterium]
MNSSIRLNLLKLLAPPLLIINLLGGGLTYWLAWEPAEMAFDQSLADAAWALVPRLREMDGLVQIDLPQQAEQILRVDRFDEIYFTVRDADGKSIAGDKDFPAPVLHTRGMTPAAYDGNMRGEPVRLFALKMNIGNTPVYIGVAETLRKRTRIKSVMLVALLLLEGVLTFVSMLIVWYAVTTGLIPLKKMQSDLNSRSGDELSPVKDEAIPSELSPVVHAINGLLSKVQLGATAQQNFLANVAHQLRTPLAGLKMQIEWLQQRYATEAETAQSASRMMSSTERMIRQTNQLLSLARAEPSQFKKTRLEMVELDKLVENAIQHFVAEADKKEIDLGFELQPAKVKGDRFLLRDMMENLIDNALRYSPQRGTVTVSCFQAGSQGVFAVADSGPGIPPAARDLIFDRFYRLDDKVAGSGLGLAIVRDIAKDHGAEITLTSGEHGEGTTFSVQFPA